MNRSTFCEIKYMNRLFFFFSKDVYMIGVGFKILTRTPVPKLPELPPTPPPPNRRGYKRVYKFKEHYIFCEIKYMNRLGFFKGRVYDWGWFQNTDSHTRTLITPSSHSAFGPPPPHWKRLDPAPSLKLFHFLSM